MIKILHVAETLKGGIASYFEEILPYQVSVYGKDNVAILVPQNQLQYLGELKGVKVFTISEAVSRPKNTLALYRMLCRLNEKEEIGLIHAHSSFAGLAARLFGKTRNKTDQIVYCAHGWAFDRDTSEWKNSFYRRFESFLSRWCAAVICISNHDLGTAKAAKIPEEKLLMISNGIASTAPAADEPEWPESTTRFLFVGRLDKQKGADLFSAAMEALGDKGFGYLVGDNVVGKSKQLSLPENVMATGWLNREQIQSYMKSADVVVIPSRWEGFGLVALEAMRAGKAVIASSAGALSEIVIDGVTGTIVDANSVESLQAAMEKACAEDWSSYGEAGKHRFMEHYTSERLNQDLSNVYAQVLSRPNELSVC